MEKYYRSTDNIKTEMQWLKEGYILKDDAKGLDGWNNRHCTFRVLRYEKSEVIQNEQKAKEELKKIRHEYYLNKVAEQKRLEKVDKARDEWHTEWQWNNYRHRKVNDDAKGESGRELNRQYTCYCFGNEYMYYHFDDTTGMSDEEIKEIKNRLERK